MPHAALVQHHHTLGVFHLFDQMCGPQGGHPLLALDNVVLTPHLGYATRDNMAAFYVSAVEAIRDWIEGRAPTPLAG